ncbi:RNA polymerase subunit sigma-24 [Actinomadura craniellae]|uniref:RNA polymerase subunit sigma-24 n=2 Tax=Actinomadura craniellae TaxID=2231787 RepID=A0A365HDW2_9ACTN|nr:RNA polymerase subunit sigma-24 [Actinomadura craniellae]
MRMDVPDSTAARDGRLRHRLVLGDETALEDAYDLFAPVVHGVAVRVTGDPEGARDVTQEVFVALWERPHAFDPGRGSLRGFLATIAHRRAVDWVRREVRVRRTVPPDDGRPVNGVEDGVLAGELARAVRHRLAALPPVLRDVLEMAYYRGHTYREVAAILGIPEGTAKSRIRSALARLGRELEREGLP